MRIVLFDHPFYESANLGKLTLSTNSIALNTISWCGLYRETPPYSYVALAPLRQNPVYTNILGVILVRTLIVTNVFCEKALETNEKV